MVVYTDNPVSAAALLPPPAGAAFEPCDTVPDEDSGLVADLLGTDTAVHAAPMRPAGWNLVLVRDTAPGSQYDQLIARARAGSRARDRTVCIARTGTGFHGFRQRKWSAGAGNIHLTVQLVPDRVIERFDTVFAALAAVSVVDAIDQVVGLDGAASIKWVNDVLVQGRKVAGVLAYTQTRGPTVTTAILGIGVNVEYTPAVQRSRFVPGVASLSEVVPAGVGVAAADVLHSLLLALDRNYRLLLSEGYRSIMDRYRQRSAVIGQHVTICADVRPGEDGPEWPEVITSGRVEAIGDSLELHLHGTAQPVTSGRLILGRLQGTS